MKKQSLLTPLKFVLILIAGLTVCGVYAGLEIWEHIKRV